jgi:hypothetical protein
MSCAAMGGRSATASRSAPQARCATIVLSGSHTPSLRSGVASRAAAAAALCAALGAVACSATSPPPFPPRRVDFPEQAPRPADEAAEAALARPADLPDAAQPPVRDDRYIGWTLAADVVSLVPLVVWMFEPERLYLAAPALVLCPTIHAAHGEMRSAGISLAMRATMLGGAYLVGRWSENECDRSTNYFCAPATLALADLAIVPVILIDSAFLARTTRPAPEWFQLPLLSAALDGGGRRLVTLTARF